MRDTRRTREMLVVIITAAVGAVIGDYYLKPLLNKELKVKVK